MFDILTSNVEDENVRQTGLELTNRWKWGKPPEHRIKSLWLITIRPGIGGSHFGVNLPTIPALAEGGIVTKATMALVGEGKEHEAVIPLSKLDKLVSRSVEKVLNAKEDSKDNKPNNNIYEIIIPVDGKTIAKVVIDSMGNILNGNANSRAVVRGGGTNARFAF